MNPRFARLLCRVWGHNLDGVEPALYWTVGGCHRCGARVRVRRGYRMRVIRP